MKQKDIKFYSNYDLLRIKKNINIPENLPYNIGKFIITENVDGVGNIESRKFRIIKIINAEIITRFDNQTLEADNFN